MKDWLCCFDSDIENMTFKEAQEIVERQINLGHSKGDFRPRKHMTKALEIILNKALEKGE